MLYYVYSNGENTVRVAIHRFSTGGERWNFTIGKKFYDYSKPSFAKARLEKLGYEFVDAYIYHSKEA